jgi:peptidoglycan/LPS O-acetylase OafA/YrhL
MYAIMAATLLYLWVFHQTNGLTWGGVCSQAFYYTNYWFREGRIPGLGVLWSLAVEEHFYLFFPPLFLLLANYFRLSYRQIALVLLGLCALSLVWRFIVVFTFSNGLVWTRDATDCRADSILYGCALACWERTPAAARVFTRQNLERVAVPCCAVLLLLTLVLRNPIFRETLRYTIQGVAIAPMLYYVVHFPDRWLGKILNTRWLATFGTLSYSLYLIHLTVLEQLDMVLPSKVVVAVVGLVISIALAFVVHVLVEKPTDTWRRKLRHTRVSEEQSPSKAHGDASIAPTLVAE